MNQNLPSQLRLAADILDSNRPWRVKAGPNDPKGTYRTRAALPTPPRRVPLTAADVPPGSVFRANKETNCFPSPWYPVTSISKDEVELSKSIHPAWITLFYDWEINASIPLTGKWDPEAWSECSKLEA